MMFRHPLFLYLIPLVIAWVIFVKRSQNKTAGFVFSTGALLEGLKESFKIKIWRHLIYVWGAAIVFLLLALARPQTTLDEGRIRKEGIEIVLTLDCSTSMLAEDFTWGNKRLNRIDVVKKVVKDFIKERPDDRMGVVAFGSVAYTLCPLTLDHEWLLKNIDRIQAGMLQDGTAIGTAVMVAINRLKDSLAKSKIIILLTDGINNAGTIKPLMAAEAAGALRIKLYIIGAGSKGLVPYPFQDIFGSIAYRNIELNMDEDMLQEMSRVTGGSYFRATDTESLKKIYAQINLLEKTPAEEKGYQQHKELFSIFALCAALLLCLNLLCRFVVLKKIP
jgi:Ca-activated chloride channel family protein